MPFRRKFHNNHQRRNKTFRSASFRNRRHRGQINHRRQPHQRQATLSAPQVIDRAQHQNPLVTPQPPTLISQSQSLYLLQPLNSSCLKFFIQPSNQPSRIPNIMPHIHEDDLVPSAQTPLQQLQLQASSASTVKHQEPTSDEVVSCSNESVVRLHIDEQAMAAISASPKLKSKPSVSSSEEAAIEHLAESVVKSAVTQSEEITPVEEIKLAEETSVPIDTVAEPKPSTSKIIISRIAPKIEKESPGASNTAKSPKTPANTAKKVAENDTASGEVITSSSSSSPANVGAKKTEQPAQKRKKPAAAKKNEQPASGAKQKSASSDKSKDKSKNKAPVLKVKVEGMLNRKSLERVTYDDEAGDDDDVVEVSYSSKMKRSISETAPKKRSITPIVAASPAATTPNETTVPSKKLADALKAIDKTRCYSCKVKFEQELSPPMSLLEKATVNGQKQLKVRWKRAVFCGEQCVESYVVAEIGEDVLQSDNGRSGSGLVGDSKMVACGKALLNSSLIDNETINDDGAKNNGNDNAENDDADSDFLTLIDVHKPHKTKSFDKRDFKLADTIRRQVSQFLSNNPSYVVSNTSLFVIAAPRGVVVPSPVVVAERNVLPLSFSNALQVPSVKERTVKEQSVNNAKESNVKEALKLKESNRKEDSVKVKESNVKETLKVKESSFKEEIVKDSSSKENSITKEQDIEDQSLKDSSAKDQSFKDSSVKEPIVAKEHGAAKEQCSKETSINAKVDQATDDDKDTAAILRNKAKESIFSALKKRMQAAEDMAQMEDSALHCLVNEIETELYRSFPDGKDKRYANKVRSLKMNISQDTNQSFFRKILTGQLTPNRLPSVSQEEMASDELAMQRKRERDIQLKVFKRHSDEVARDYAKHQAQLVEKDDENNNYLAVAERLPKSVATLPFTGQRSLSNSPEIAPKLDHHVSVKIASTQPFTCLTNSVDINNNESFKSLKSNTETHSKQQQVGDSSPTFDWSFGGHSMVEVTTAQNSESSKYVEAAADCTQTVTWQGHLRTLQLDKLNMVGTFLTNLSVSSTTTSSRFASSLAANPLPKQLEFQAVIDVKANFWGYLSHVHERHGCQLTFVRFEPPSATTTHSNGEPSLLYDAANGGSYSSVPDKQLFAILFNKYKRRIIECKVPPEMADAVGCFYLVPLSQKPEVVAAEESSTTALKEDTFFRSRFDVSIRRNKDIFVGVFTDLKSKLSTDFPTPHGYDSRADASSTAAANTAETLKKRNSDALKVASSSDEAVNAESKESPKSPKRLKGVQFETTVVNAASPCENESATTVDSSKAPLETPTPANSISLEIGEVQQQHNESIKREPVEPAQCQMQTSALFEWAHQLLESLVHKDRELRSGLTEVVVRLSVESDKLAMFEKALICQQYGYLFPQLVDVLGIGVRHHHSTTTCLPSEAAQTTQLQQQKTGTSSAAQSGATNDANVRENIHAVRERESQAKTSFEDEDSDIHHKQSSLSEKRKEREEDEEATSKTAMTESSLATIKRTRLTQSKINYAENKNSKSSLSPHRRGDLSPSKSASKIGYKRGSSKANEPTRSRSPSQSRRNGVKKNETKPPAAYRGDASRRGGYPSSSYKRN